MSLLNSLNSIGNILSKAGGSVGNIGKAIVQYTAVRLSTVAKTVQQNISQQSFDSVGVDVDYYIREACLELVPVKFEGVMIGLRVKYTLDSQLYGLAIAISNYIDIDPSELWEEGSNLNSETDDIISSIYDIVSDRLDSIEDEEGVCKKFWNGYDLEIE